jgi:anti-anti-sigma factor
VNEQATFQRHDERGIVVVKVAGEIDIANIDQFTSFVLDAARDANGAVVISLEGISYLDSHTVAALAEFDKRLRTNRRRLVVVAPATTSAGRILRIASLELIVRVCDSLEDAFANLSVS